MTARWWGGGGGVQRVSDMLQHRSRRAGVSSYLSCRLSHSLLLGSVPLAGAESDLSRYGIRYSLLVIVAGPLER